MAPNAAGNPAGNRSTPEEDRLHKYRQKRDFWLTPEPEGFHRHKPYPFEEPIFVVQKHRARSLHYDFRIESEGILLSWAVPKGPSTDPAQKRLAVRTEDHPLEYASFEGVIPSGQYGAGTVLVWDVGFFRCLDRGTEALERGLEGEREALRRALERGRLKLWLEGHKLRGGYNLTRIRERRQEQWLLVKLPDSEAAPERNPVETQPDSVLTGRTLEEIAAGKRA